MHYLKIILLHIKDGMLFQIQLLYLSTCLVCNLHKHMLFFLDKISLVKSVCIQVKLHKLT